MLIAVIAFGFVVVIMAILVARNWLDSRSFRVPTARPVVPAGLPPGQIHSFAGTLPGPAREAGASAHLLTEGNSLKFRGRDDAANERWRDIADNLYSPAFVSNFSYEPGRARTPVVRVRVDPRGETLSGRLEATGLKPNFAYQMKLRGVFEYRRNFETIGLVGRWRLPGEPTNYTDADYYSYPDKSKVEAYIVFDFFVTDCRGDAVREFALDSTLHVLFKGSQFIDPPVSGVLPVSIDASDPSIYASPSNEKVKDTVIAQRETCRYSSDDQVIRLPAGEYHAELVLTEESFHASSIGGGYWATVMACPVTFTVISPAGHTR